MRFTKCCCDGGDKPDLNMKCYNHPDTDAVGICQRCGKGICKLCATEIGNKVVCKDSCDAMPKRKPGESVVINSEGKVVYKGKLYMFATKWRFRATFYFIIGIALFAFSAAVSDQNRWFILFGVFTILFGLFILVKGWTAERKNT